MIPSATRPVAVSVHRVYGLKPVGKSRCRPPGGAKGDPSGGPRDPRDPPDHILDHILDRACRLELPDGTDCLDSFDSLEGVVASPPLTPQAGHTPPNAALEARVSVLQDSVTGLARMLDDTSATAVRLSAVTALNVGLLAAICLLALQEACAR